MALRLIYDQGFNLSSNAVQSYFRWKSSTVAMERLLYTHF